MGARFGGWSFAGYAPAPVLRQADPAALQQLAGRSMGTSWRCKFGNPRMLPLRDVQSACEAALSRVVTQMSPWLPDSDISRFNAAPAGTRQPLPVEFAQVLRCALAWAKASDGAFDPTIAPLVDLWGFGPRPRPEDGPGRQDPPGAAEIAALRARGGWTRLELHAATDELLQPGGLRLDLSGIAKGFAVDSVLAALADLGIADALVEVGGELRASGRRPGGGPWRVAVETGAGRSCVLALEQRAVATSGDAFHAFDHGGRRYSHTLDPRTGHPVTHDVASVTVLHADCMQADALATVLCVLGPEDGVAFAREHAIAALFARRGASGWSELASPAFAALAR